VQADGHPVLELVGLHKSYGRVSALSGLDLRLERGSVYACLGRNGAGKSTTLRIVMGITRPDLGEVRLFGAPARASDVQPRQRIGYVAQEQHFYDWMKPEQLGRFVGAFYPTWQSSYFALLVRKLDIPPRKIRTFSGGTKVKLALALALAHKPELLVLDEPTAGLDPVARREFLELVRELTTSGEHATLFSSHLVDEVERISTRVGIIEAGRMRYEGALDELAARAALLLLPSDTSHELRYAFPAATARESVTRALGELPVRVLSVNPIEDRLELCLWANAPAVLSAVQQKYRAERKAMTLEDVFVALVRTQVSIAAQDLTLGAAADPIGSVSANLE
jgi:ABC-type multidrug transport system ATPase subunit